MFRRGLPTENAGLRFVAEHEGRAHVRSVLLRAVNLYGRMVAGRAEKISLLKVSRVNVCSRINDEVDTAGAHFQAQRIVVAVRAAPARADSTRVKEKIQIAVSQDVSARTGKAARALGLFCFRQAIKGAHSLAP